MTDVLAQVQEAEGHKQRGNDFVKEKEYKKALGAYHKVFLYVNYLQLPGEKNEASSYADLMGKNGQPQVPAELVEDVKRLKQSTSLNMALCYLKTTQYQKCVDACTKALAGIQSSKAYFRRGEAQLELGNLDEARQDLETAHGLEPESREIAALMQRLKKAEAQQHAKEKKCFAKMFAGKASEGAKDGNGADKSADACTDGVPETAPAES
mmetsp:Transcript_29125/g.53139  ORF Transcript_29125/g.53139 Transcript_29125/m.53139 type:complete len:210 (+) Transcript_29125:75-704(+)